MVLSLLSPRRGLQHQVYLQPVALMTSVCLPASLQKSCIICVEKLRRGKSPGINGVSADMVINGGDLLHDCILQLFNRMLATQFPECLSVGMITAIYKLEKSLT